MKPDVERGVTQHLGWGIVALGLGLMQLGLQGVQAVQAQILPNDPLNPEAAQVNAIAPGQTLIGGGALRGANLFHSFQDFNVGTGEVVLFADPGGIARIFSKVTGGNPSRIDGQFGVLNLATGNLSNADLFLLNPRGILLGPNAQSLVLGSLFLTSAEQVKFANYDFSAANPDLPPPLLQIGVPVGLQMGLSPGPVVQESANFGAGLSVAPGQSLTLLGGDIVLSGNAFWQLAGGRLELGAVGSQGNVDLTPGNRGYELDYSQTGVFQDIQLRSTWIPNAAVMDGLEAQLQGRTITFLEGAVFVSTVLGDQPGGNITIGASEGLQLLDRSLLLADVLPGASGRGGDIQVETPRFIADGGGSLGTRTFGSGQAGEVRIQGFKTDVSQANAAADIQLFNGSNINSVSIGSGSTGNIWLQANQLRLEGGSQVFGDTLAEGDLGGLEINARSIEAKGTLSNLGIPSGLFAYIGPDSSGNGDIISVKADHITLADQARIESFTVGTGRAALLEVQADHIEMVDQSIIGSRTDGPGRAGDVSITTNRLLLTGGSQIGASTFAEGDAGRLQVEAKWIEARGASRDDFVSGLFAGVEPNASGNGDALLVVADQIFLFDGGTIETRTSGLGQAASLDIRAGDRIIISGRNSQNSRSSAIASSSTDTGFQTLSGGQGGMLQVRTPLLRLEDGAVLSSKSRSDGSGGAISLLIDRLEVASGAQIQASAFEAGDSGTIAITATETIIVEGRDPKYEALLAQFCDCRTNFPESPESAIAVRSFGTGAAREIQIKTPTLQVQNQGLISVSSQGSAAGNLEITANQIVLDGGFLQANTQSGAQGNIALRGVDFLKLRHGGSITANAAATSTGGNIDIDARFILAIPNENSDITANALQGQGGRISIQTQGLFGIEFSPQLTPQSDITASSEFGLNGTVQIDPLAINPSQGLAELPKDLSDATNRINASCEHLYKSRSRFVLTGRGGLPPDPRDQLASPSILQDWREDSAISNPRTNDNSSSESSLQMVHAPTPRIEAQTWRRNAKGQIELIANANQLLSSTLLACNNPSDLTSNPNAK